MQGLVRRSAVASALVAATMLVLVLSDTAITPTAPPSLPTVETLAPFGMSAGTSHDFLITHRHVIPLGRATISVPILMYHYIRTPPSVIYDRLGFNLSVSPTVFQAQMDWLAANGYHTVNFDDLRAYFGGKTPLPAKPVVITLDDGYQDLYTTAYPILLADNFKAVAYIVSGFVGRPGYVTASEVVEMAQNGIEIAGHTVSHANLARASLPDLMYQLLASKVYLEHLVGHKVLDLAYPSGRFNFAVEAAVHLASYDTAVTEIPGTFHNLADRYAWTRVRVGGGEPLSDFIANLGPVEPTVEITEVVA